MASLRVTELRDYLACPYRYYLRHRLGLESLADDAEELAANDFGTLLHTVLKQFADDERLANATDPARLRSRFESDSRPGAGRSIWIGRAGGRPVARRANPAPAGGLRPLAGPAHAEGWRIHAQRSCHHPRRPDQSAGAEHGVADGEPPIYLRGRIDRVDVHEVTGETIVFDYKTGDHGETPEKAHREKRTDWIDLQLPLYRHLVRAAGIAGPVRLGYIVLPKDTSKVGAYLAEWDEAALATADAKALEVIRAIAAQEFWPPATDARGTRWFPELAAICQEDLLLVRAAADDDDGEEETS